VAVDQTGSREWQELQGKVMQVEMGDLTHRHFAVVAVAVRAVLERMVLRRVGMAVQDLIGIV